MKTIMADIKSGNFHSCYLIYGEESYLVRQYTDNLIDAITGRDDSMNFSRFQGKNVDENAVIDLAETLPFFAEHRLILVEDSGLFKSSPDKLPDYIAELPESSIIIFREQAVDKRNRLYKAVNKNGYVCEMKKQTEATLTKWILSQVKKEKKQITQQALSLFLEKSGTDMNVIKNELEKLFSYTLDRNAIEIEDIEAVCSSRMENHIFDMVDAISNGNSKKAFTLYADLVQLKEPAGRILYLISRQYSILLKAKELREEGHDIASIASRLSLPEFAVRKHVRLAASFEVGQLKRAIEKCIEAEESFKTGRIEDRLALETLIVELT
jgi:DNA polymerase III subunit delta